MRSNSTSDLGPAVMLTKSEVAIQKVIDSMAVLYAALQFGSAAEVRAVAAKHLVYHLGMLAGLKACLGISADEYSDACNALNEVAKQFIRDQTGKGVANNWYSQKQVSARPKKPVFVEMPDHPAPARLQ